MARNTNSHTKVAHLAAIAVLGGGMILATAPGALAGQPSATVLTWRSPGKADRTAQDSQRGGRRGHDAPARGRDDRDHGRGHDDQCEKPRRGREECEKPDRRGGGWGGGRDDHPDRHDNHGARRGVLGTLHIGKECYEVCKDEVFESIRKAACDAGYKAKLVKTRGRTYIRIFGCPTVKWEGAGYDLDVVRYYNDVIDIVIIRNDC